MTNAENNMVPSLPTDIGQWLADARQAQKLSVQQIIAELKLDAQTIQAIEAGFYEGIPPVYLRGYLRNYARLLKIDEAEILQAAAPFLTEKKVPQPFIDYSGYNDTVSMHDQRMRLTTVAIVGLFLILFFLYWWQEKRSIIEEIPSVAVAAPSVVVPEKLNTPTPLHEAGNDHSPDPEATISEEQVVSVAAADTSSLPNETETPVDEAPLMEIQLNEECWMEVVDKHGERLLTKMGQPGEHIVLSGEPPLSILLGNAEAARIYYAGQFYDITPHSKGNVARFHLGD